MLKNENKMCFFEKIGVIFKKKICFGFIRCQKCCSLMFCIRIKKLSLAENAGDSFFCVIECQRACLKAL